MYAPLASRQVIRSAPPMRESFGQLDLGTSVLWLCVGAVVIGGLVWAWKGPAAGVATAIFIAPPPGPWPL